MAVAIPLTQHDFQDVFERKLRKLTVPAPKERFTTGDFIILVEDIEDGRSLHAQVRNVDWSKKGFVTIMVDR